MKKFLSLLLVAVMVFGVIGLVGCKGGQNETTTTTTTQGAQTTTTTTKETTTTVGTTTTTTTATTPKDTTTTTTTTTATTPKETTTETTTTTTTEMVTTTLPTYVRFDFGTNSRAQDEKKTTHEWLVENLSIDSDYVAVEWTEDSIKVTARKSYDASAGSFSWSLAYDNMLSLDFEDVLMPAYGTWREYPHRDNYVGKTWQGYHQYVKVRLRSNSVNNMIGFLWQTGTNPYAMTMAASNMYLDGGVDNKTRKVSENWFVGIYDISLCQSLASGKFPTGCNANSTYSDLVKSVEANGYNAGNNWAWQAGKEITGLRFNVLGACASVYRATMCDSRENITRGNWVEIDYIIFGSTPEQLEAWKSKSEAANA